MFKIGLIVNPYAGLGGAVALKGSDGEDIRQQALALGAVSKVEARLGIALGGLADYLPRIEFVGFDGLLAKNYLVDLGIDCRVIGAAPDDVTSATDTVAAAQALETDGVDLLIFVGGDGTARNIFDAVSNHLPVLGLPCGVKMHSSVFAISPLACGEIIKLLLDGKLVNVAMREVRDIDEHDLRGGRIQSKYYGELLVPEAGHFLQATKVSGREVEALVVNDIAAEVIESMSDDTLYIIGPGTTPAEIMHQLGLDNSLLGFDLVCDQTLVASDVTEQDLIASINDHKGEVKVVLTATGGQGQLIGRGNQQLSAAVLALLDKSALIIVATKTKIVELEGRPLRIDSSDLAIDRKFSGFYSVITGYRDYIMYALSGD